MRPGWLFVGSSGWFGRSLGSLLKHTGVYSCQKAGDAHLFPCHRDTLPQPCNRTVFNSVKSQWFPWFSRFMAFLRSCSLTRSSRATWSQSQVLGTAARPWSQLLVCPSGSWPWWEQPGSAAAGVSGCQTRLVLIFKLSQVKRGSRCVCLGSPTVSRSTTLCRPSTS